MGTEITPTTRMTAAEAEAACDRINAALGDVDYELRMIYTREGWVALGYDTMVALVEDRLGGSRRNAFRRVATLEVTAAIEAAQPASDARVTPTVSDRQAARLAADTSLLDGVIDTVSRGADPAEAIKAALAGSPAKKRKPRPKKPDVPKPPAVDFEASTVEALAALGDRRLEAVQKKINNARHYIRTLNR